MEAGKQDFFEETSDVFKDYVEDRILLLKIQAAEKSGKLVAALFTLAVVCLFSFFILLFVSIMGAYYFAGITGSTFYGFSIIAGIYLLLLLLFLMINRQFLSKRIIDMVIKIFFERSSVENDLNDQND